jgi:hypothetical protein
MSIRETLQRMEAIQSQILMENADLRMSMATQAVNHTSISPPSESPVPEETPIPMEPPPETTEIVAENLEPNPEAEPNLPQRKRKYKLL